ncbi:MAG: transglycosylase domain-containing protein [Methylacidiphilales bacterium]|nr:transglycosylase domain-containing protein [Candidatus Methylacidiphilales bacterium]
MKRLLRSLLLGLGLLIMAGLALRFCLPAPDLWESVKFSRCYYDREGNLLRATLADDQTYRIRTPLKEISPLLVQATLLHEDRYFGFHPGFNPVALGKSALNEMTGLHRRFGASTIPMQLARIRFHLNTRTWPGKFIQVLRAVQIEYTYSKNEILEAYLNQASYGRNIEGIGAASIIYYGKTPDKLSLAEAVTLSVIPQSPARRAPRFPGETARGNDALLKARAALFAQWVEEHPQDAGLRPTLDMALQVKTPRNLPFLAPHFVDSLACMSQSSREIHQLSLFPINKTTGAGNMQAINPDAGLSAFCSTFWQNILCEFSKEDESSGLDSRAAQYRVHSTLELSLQHTLEREVSQFVEKRRSGGVNNAAALLIDSRNMEVLAAVGSADYFSKDIDGQVNGTTMRRSPGSTLKPLLYALAMDEGLIQPHSLLKDAPSGFAGYNPENYDREFAGPIQACTALQQSRNVPAVWLSSRLKKHTLYQLLSQTGVKNLQEETHYGLTLALGSSEVSMEELARLYAMLANRGAYRPLRTSLDEVSAEKQQLLSPEACFMVLDILKQTGRPDSLRSEGLRNNGGAVAWKTGTSWSLRDAWSVGVFDHYILVVWVGNFSGEGNEAFVGRRTAAPLLFGMIDAIRARISEAAGLADWEKSDGLNLERVDLCALSGEPAGAHCPRTIKDWFIPGVSPIQTCTVHQEIYVDTRTGRRVRKPTDAREVHTEVYEVWTSDLLELFRKAGLPRRTPPTYAGVQTQTLPANSDNASEPVITSPQQGVTYALRTAAAGEENKQTLLLQASAAPGADSLYWFADSTYLGKTRPEETLAWKPLPGAHHISVTDAQGRSASRQVTVEAAQ